jgi:hypothetical protein
MQGSTCPLPRPTGRHSMPNDYLPLPIDSNVNVISKYLEHGGFVTLNQDSGEYSYGYGPSGISQQEWG